MKKETEFCSELNSILTELPSWKTLFRLFDLDPNVFVYIKNKRKQFLWMNIMLRELLGIKGEADFLKKTDYDFLPANWAVLYQNEDDRIFSSHKEIINQPWIIQDKRGNCKWYISSKVPLFVSGQKLVGLAGIMRDVSENITKDPLNEFRKVVEYILRHYHEKIRVEDLASIVYLSVSQFERKFSQVFQMTPSDFILKVRIDSSIRFLIDGDCSVTDVALQCGFYDNSHFTRNFKKITGTTPLEFRRQYSLGAGIRETPASPNSVGSVYR